MTNTATIMIDTKTADIMIETISRAVDEVNALAQGPDAERWVMRFPSGLYVCNAESNSGLARAMKWDSHVDARTQAGDMRDGNGDKPAPHTVCHAAELDKHEMRRALDSILTNINEAIRAND
jgi:hypothetical protein